MSFTPGPWKVQEDDYGYWGVYDKAGNCLAEAPEPEDRANIRIMALVPEMVSLLEDYDESLSEMKLDDWLARRDALLRRIENAEE